MLSFGLLKQLAHHAPAQLYHDYWQRSLTMAAVASRLASYYPELAAGEAYSAGLLSDVGTLVLAQLETKSYVRLHQKAGHGSQLVESERELYGFHHGQLGARLLDRWNLPDDLSTAIALHHEEPTADDRLSLIVHAANLMADALLDARVSPVHAARRLLESQFTLDLDGFITLAVHCQEMIRESAELYQVHLAGKIDCDELLRTARQQVHGRGHGGGPRLGLPGSRGRRGNTEA